MRSAIDILLSGKTMWPDRSPRASGKLTELQDQALRFQHQNGVPMVFQRFSAGVE